MVFHARPNLNQGLKALFVLIFNRVLIRVSRGRIVVRCFQIVVCYEGLLWRIIFSGRKC